MTVKLCSVSDPTARSYLKQLSLVGIATLTNGNPMRNRPDRITLADPYRWLNPDLEI
jgi:hypothetical protein